MATRWGVPCGCILLFSIDGSGSVVDVSAENKCVTHADVADADLYNACTNFCIEKAQQEQADAGGA